MVFPVVTCSCESWTEKKTERQRIDAFELWCWRRLPRVPWTTGRSNQSILREINPDYSLGGLMLKLKLNLQYFGSPDANSWLIGKVPDAGKDWGQKKKLSEDEMAGWCHQCNGYDLRWWGTGRPGVLQSRGLQRVRHNRVTEQQPQWWHYMYFK